MKCIHLLLFALLFIASCNSSLTGYPFKIQAIYEAPRSKLQITVNAQGHVPPGSDISAVYKGAVLIETLTNDGEKVQLVFADRNEVTYTIHSRSPSWARWGLRESEDSLIFILKQSGYSQVDSEEVAEIVKVIDGAIAGPKAVTLDGQAKHLIVSSVHSVR